MSQLPVAEVVRTLRELPALPVIVLELLRSFEQPDVAIDTLAERIGQDQALAARTLRLANSSFYGLPAKVKTINHAIAVLGFDSVRTLVSAGGIVASFSGPNAHVDLAAFWRHAIASAVCARALARHAGLNAEYAFISGLLHDIGKLVLATRFPTEYAAARDWRARNDSTMVEAEQVVLGIDHQRVGLMLAESWKFPLLIRRAIANHHRPLQEDIGDLPALVHVADAIVHALDLDGAPDALVPPLVDAAWDSLGLDSASLHGILADTCKHYEEVCQLLSA